MPCLSLPDCLRRCAFLGLFAVLSQNFVLAATDEETSFFSRFFRPTPDAEPSPIIQVDSESLIVHELGSGPGLSKTIDLTAQPDDLWVRIRNGFAMPDLNDDLVLHYQQWYQNRPDALRRMVERSRPYMHHIVAEIEARGMPTELALLPMVESSFNPMAYSRANASGLWQFIPSTGKRFNLEQNWWQDQRRDIVASTGAALEYLQTIYEMNGDWHLALASYNWGEGAVKRAIEKNLARGYPTDFVNLNMPNETRHYVPKLQALKNIFGNPLLMRRLNLPEIKNTPYFSIVETGRQVDVKTAARLANMPLQEFLALNPAHNRPVIQESSQMVIPSDKVQTFQSNLESNREPLSAWQAYVVKPGEKLAKLATRFGIAISDLLRINGLSGKAKAAPGTTLLVPSGAGEADLGHLPMVAKLPKIADPEPVRAVAAKHGHREPVAKDKGKDKAAKPGKPVAHVSAGKEKMPAKSVSTAKAKNDKPAGKAQAAGKPAEKKHH